jgi:TonB family protein
MYFGKAAFGASKPPRSRHVASAFRRTAVLLFIWSAGAPPAAQEPGVRLRDWAATGQTENIRKLLSGDNKVAVDSPDEAGWTPLMHAANAGREANVRLLLDAGANVRLQNHAQETALHMAARQGSTEVVRLLLGAGADFAARDGEGRSPLFRAIERGRAEIIDLLHAAALASFNRRSPVLVGSTEAETVPPTLVHWEEASYTDEAWKQRIEGTVVLMAIVGPDGSVGAASVSKGLEEGLDRSALAAVRNWKFDPATRAGKPVNVVVQISVDFELPNVP